MTLPTRAAVQKRLTLNHQIRALNALKRRVREAADLTPWSVDANNRQALEGPACGLYGTDSSPANTPMPNNTVMY